MKTPGILWLFVWLFALGVGGFALYEIAAVKWHWWPTISALVKPNVHANLLLSIALAVLFMAFIGFLVWDWFVS